MKRVLTIANKSWEAEPLLYDAFNAKYSFSLSIHLNVFAYAVL